MSMNWNDDATFDEVLAVLEQAQRKVVEARYEAGLKAEAAKKEETHEP